MEQIYNWQWVQTHVSQTIEVWNESAGGSAESGRRYTPEEQRQCEQAYDEALHAVELEIKRGPRTTMENLQTQDRIVSLFATFSASALGLEGDAIQLLTNDFLPIGTKLARWTRSFDPNLSMSDIIQACRNAWTAAGLQPLLGVPVSLTPSILGYSLLYPYSDNYLDQHDISTDAKLRFSQRFRRLLQGEKIAPSDPREIALQSLIALIEFEYPRARYPQVFDCLLAIHRAQEESIQQVRNPGSYDASGLLRLSCGKGGTSVLADACLAYGSLTQPECRFAFEWGVLLQLGDDLQDLQEDMSRGSATLFSQAAAQGKSLDRLAIQLLNFSEKVAGLMDRLPNGDATLKELLRMSWRSLIVRAVADSHAFFSPAFVAEAERRSPFRFGFLRTRQRRLAGRQGLYGMLFNAFLETRGENDGPPSAAQTTCAFAGSIK